MRILNLTDQTAQLTDPIIQHMFERSVYKVYMKNTGPLKALGVRITVNVIVDGLPGLVTTHENIRDTTASDLHPDVVTERTDALRERLPNIQIVEWQYAVLEKLRLYGTLT